MLYRVSSRLILALACIVAAACDDSPFDPSTIGSEEGIRCDPKQSGECGSGLDCYVPPNCTFAVCCPPQDPANPVCYCASGNGGSDGGEDNSGESSVASDAALWDVRVSD